METIKCVVCELIYPINFMNEDDVEACKLCIAVCVYEETDNYKDRWCAQHEINNIMKSYKQADVGQDAILNSLGCLWDYNG